MKNSQKKSGEKHFLGGDVTFHHLLNEIKAILLVSHQDSVVIL